MHMGVIKMCVGDVDRRFMDLFNEFIGGKLDTTEDVKKAIKKTKELIAQTRKALKEAKYLRRLVLDTVVPMCGDIGLEREAKGLLEKIESKESDLKDLLTYAEGRLEWLYKELERIRKKEEFERRKRLYKYMKEHLL